MKKYTYSLAIILLLAFAGCNDFLKEQSLDEVRPSTILELQQLLNKEGYASKDDALFPYIDLLTDDSECFGPQNCTAENYISVLDQLKDFFIWSNDMFKKTSDSQSYNSWEIFYKKILGCNLVLDYINKVEGDQSDKMNVKGQALGLRAYYYLMLVNLYGQPYHSNIEKPETSWGVPLRLIANFSDTLPVRNTVKIVYEQIEQDLLNATKSFQASNNQNRNYQMSQTGAYALLSRMYLYKEDFDKALIYCNLVLDRKSKLKKLTPTTPDDRLSVYSTGSEEIIWHFESYDLSKIYKGMPYSSEKGFFQVSDQLMASYTPTPEGLTDLRIDKFYMKFTSSSFETNPLFGSKDDNNGNTWTSDGIRVAEIYLNRAEIYIHQFTKTGDHNDRIKALSDLNYLRSCRFSGTAEQYVPVDYMDATQLLNFYKEERRRELAFEGLHRWCDLRRWGMPVLEHTYISKSGVASKVILKQGDLRYVLLIPQIVLEQNYLLKQNAR